MRRLLLVLSACLCFPATADYRGYWVETFNTRLSSRADIDAVVQAAVRSNANALFAQMRRRGDSWYLETKEPLTEVPGTGEPDAGGRWTFDPLRYLIDQAHARSIEVHAFVIIGAVHNADPGKRVPADRNHVFLRHIWNQTTGALHTGRNQWATRALPHNLDDTSFDGRRFGSEWYVDLGHPDAAAYTADVLTHLARQYDVDGIHLDRVRYPEAPIDNAPRGINVGYNETSVERFRRRYGSRARYYESSDVGSNGIGEGDVGNPRSSDALWNDWRREQVTRFVRRVYLHVKAVRPSIRVSAALITFGSGPTANGGFQNTEPYDRVFQDWKAWAEEGTLDLLVPMVYKRENIAAQLVQFDDWSRFATTLAHSHGRLSLIGLGAYLNSIEGTLRQARRALGHGADGNVFYALANTNASVSSNPHAYPNAGVSTPQRPSGDLFSAFTTGASVDGTTRFESPALTPIFATPIAAPHIDRSRGHLMGVVPGAGTISADGIEVVLEHLASGAQLTTSTDGSGFFGAVHLQPGTYRIRTTVDSTEWFACTVDVFAGSVAVAEVTSSRCRVPARRRAL